MIWLGILSLPAVLVLLSPLCAQDLLTSFLTRKPDVLPRLRKDCGSPRFII